MDNIAEKYIFLVSFGFVMNQIYLKRCDQYQPFTIGMHLIAFPVPTVHQVFRMYNL